MLVDGLWVLLAASWLFWLIAWWLTRRFFSKPLVPVGFTPPVSILKPVKGVDAQAYDNFVSFCEQDYPEFELLFGVDDPKDPAIPLIERLRSEYPLRRIRLLVVPPAGLNPKAGVLEHLRLKARHEILAVSDSDIRVDKGYLRRVVAPLASPRVGLVTCPYRGEAPLTLTARLEALHMGVTFMPWVIVARTVLRMRFALGASQVLRGRDLAALGGFTAVADYLADDYQLGMQMAAAGKPVHLSTHVVGTSLGATSFEEQWQREVRWMRTSRVSRPREYPAVLLTLSTPLAVLLALLTRFEPAALWALLGSMLLRWVVAWPFTTYIGDRGLRPWLFLLPLRDLLSALTWTFGLVGTQVVWRGERFTVQPDGRLAPRRRLAAQPAGQETPGR